MNRAVLAPLFYRELEKIIENELLQPLDQVSAYRDLLHLLFFDISKVERLHFSTHFARIAYVGHKYGLTKKLLYRVHQFRYLAQLAQSTQQVAPDVLELGKKTVAVVIEALCQSPIPASFDQYLTKEWPLQVGQVEIADYLPELRVIVVDNLKNQKQLLAYTEARPDDAIKIQYGLPERNAFFQPSVDLLGKVLAYPVTLNLLDVEVDTAGIYRPRAFVIEPDYLIEVTAVASCYGGQEPHVWSYLLRKLLPFRTSVPIMIGNIANFFLDELINNADKSFGELKQQIFSLNPLAFCVFDNGDVRKMIDKSQLHYVNLRKVVKEGLIGEGINPNDCYLEPSFYSAQYGIQGRLDLLHRPEQEGHTAIVELKSGKPYRANVHGISPAHFTQTLLYDLLIRSAFGEKSNPANYMLYSGEEDRHLRFAPASRIQQLEAIQVRNQLIAIEWLLAGIRCDSPELLEESDRIFGRLNPDKFPMVKGYARDDLENFRRQYQVLNPLEKAYFASYCGFVAREHRLAKMGVQGAEKGNGLASLWLDKDEDKERQYNILRGLYPIENKANATEPVLSFLRTERSNPLANFRQGDIVVLYPSLVDKAGVLYDQIFRCTIIHIDNKTVQLRLRARQFNDRLFSSITEWSLEPDLLDSSFNVYYRGLFAFAAAKPEIRNRLLTISAPAKASVASGQLEPVPGMTEEQFHILEKMLIAPEYFLLWGPPGTGKTSVMLKHFVAYLLTASQERLLLLAYTNRAVDEICAAIESIHPGVRDQYLRIGSRYGTGAAYQERLLKERSIGIQRRVDLRSMIEDARIIVGTLSSIMGKPELFQIKSFDRVVIDEASQILEPSLMGMLTQVERFVLIGDHRQLPAVVQQSAEDSSVADAGLRSIGLSNLRNSYFERLYQRCQEENWDWAYAQLSHQGRMHQEIMAFPSRQFYNSRLTILPAEITHRQKQEQSIQIALPDDVDANTYKLAHRRLLFLPTPIDRSSVTGKTNRLEAERIGDLLEHFRWLDHYNQREWKPENIGIITPYRAQIAQIRQVLLEREFNPEDYTIDTVERYQGGARDIILISLCTNHQRQIEQLSTLSNEGIDRKLNVAMTRARERLLILGNPALLRTSKAYVELLQYCYSEDAWMELD